jgi:hypothetical protein
VRLRSPHIYQETNGARREVRGRYVITSKNNVGFEVATYDRRGALVIDPVLAYSTYLGGSQRDIVWGIAIDSAGNAYMTGLTLSSDYPTANAIQPTNYIATAFVTKMDAAGDALLYSTYLGGSGGTEGYRIAVDASGNAYITGSAGSDFPVVNAIQDACGGISCWDAFVTKINAAGNALVYSTYLGGSGEDDGYGLALDASGNAYITGFTASTDFPTVNAIQSIFGGWFDAFVTKINPTGSALVYSTYLGGSAAEYDQDIAVDAAGEAYITGWTYSNNFPTVHAIQPTNHSQDAFITKINAAGNGFVYSTYLGGSNAEQGLGITADSAGNAYVTGDTLSFDFPTANALQSTNGGYENAFVTKISPDGDTLVYSTYLGGSGYAQGRRIAVDSAKEAYVTGVAGINFPVVNAIKSKGTNDAFVTKISADGSTLIYSTYLGGRGSDYGNAIAVDAAGTAYVTGETNSTNFPKTLLAYQPSLKGDSDAFVTKIASQTFVSVSPAKIAFATLLTNTTSAPKQITISNNGFGTLTIANIFIGGANAGDFAETNNCPPMLSAGGFCTVSVTFTPIFKNKRLAALGISDSDPASPQTIPLSGTGTAVSLSPKSLAFGKVTVGNTSSPKTVILANVGSAQLNFSGITITGTSASDFSQTNTCGTSIAAGANCAITVTLKPTTLGVRKAAVSISDDGGGSPQTIALSGTGT